MIEKVNTIKKAPDYSGAAGMAWELDLRSPVKPDHYAAVYAALLYAPMAHAFWNYHLLNVTSLRDIVGVAPAKKHYLEAEYEISIFAINPEVSLPEPEAGVGYDLLQPYDVIRQFDGINAEQALELGKTVMKACCDGFVIPDSDFRSRFNQVIDQTVEHLRTGGQHG